MNGVVEIMGNIIVYLLSNPEVIQQLQDGSISLEGIGKEDVALILKEVNEFIAPLYYWR